MTLNSRKDYIDGDDAQGSKSHSLILANQFAKEIQATVAPLLTECVIYNSEKTLGKAPAVELPNGKLAIAPDIRCVTHSGKVFWFEIKDKAQRFYYPDTGADLFQVYGWYNINKFYDEPVFVLFKDPSLKSCLPRNPSELRLKEFKARWLKFNGNPYGGWLGNLLILNDNYPRIFDERSRELRMHILYFLVNSMKPIEDWKVLIDEVENGIASRVGVSFEAYSHPSNRLLNEIEIRQMIARTLNNY